MPPEAEGYSGVYLNSVARGKSTLFIVPVQGALDLTPLPYSSKEFEKMPRATCHSCLENMPVQLLAAHCGILWDSEGLNWLRWTGRNILPRTIALNKWINQILFVLWLMCLFCLFSCRLNISRGHQILKTCHHPVLLLTLCHPLTTLQMTLPILACLWQ